MRPGHHIVIGVTLLTLAAALAAVGEHDGVVGMTPPEAFPAPGQAPAEVTTRLVVDGPVGPNHPARDASLSGLGGATLVQAHVDGPALGPVILVLHGPAPPAGSVLIVHGSVQTILMGQGEGAFVRLDAREVREPLLFKSA